ncbi:MAG TPA: hypothetical protein VF759_10400 [Allosphingosinicella sp.]|jgi:hypothetical protein
MDPEDPINLAILASVGMLLTQLRSARRALEDVQRSTARYGGFEFARAFTAGDRFGQPPMFDGALMVHVVNINDLAPGNSFGGFLESLFGGIGNFFGNLIGGVVGGTLSAFRLRQMLERLENIVANINLIMTKIGIGEKRPDDATKAKSSPEAQANTGESLLTTLEGIKSMVRDVTALLEVGAGKGSEAGAKDAAKTSQTPMTETGERWMAILNGVNILLDRTGRLVNGLVLLIPMAVGGIAFLVGNLGEIRRALLETVQFLLKNALILRGVLLTIVFETVASAARLAGAVVGIIGTTIQSVLSAIFAVIQTLLGAAFDAIETLTNALQAIIGSLLQWLVDGVFNTLRAIGDLTVFRTIDHLTRILPSLLPAIYMLKSSTSLPDEVLQMLRQSHDAGFRTPPGGTPGAPGGAIQGAGNSATTQIIGEFPDIKKILKPTGATISAGVGAAGSTVAVDVKASIDAMTTSLSGVAGKFDAAARKEGDFSKRVLDKYGQQIKGRADELTVAITAPLEAVGPETGFEDIAKTYEKWLTGGGMKSVLDLAAKHFQDSPKAGEEPTGALRLLRGQFDRPRASIEIDEVEIVIEPRKELEKPFIEVPPGLGPGDFNLPNDETMWAAVRRHERERLHRGIVEPDELVS